VKDRACEPSSPPTPLPVENRPGLHALAYRVGDYPSFRQAMTESLARAQALSGLTTRRSDDFSITLLELWAAVGDVLTFYQERYANEAFLRTARRPESVMRLAALLGYRLAPGAAALSRLSFTIEAAKSVQLPPRLRVQSLPGPGEQAQVFETLEPLLADARLNELRIFPAPSTTPAPLAAGQSEVVLDRTKGPGLATALAAGTRAVLFRDNQSTPVEEKTIAAVRTEDDRAVVTWTEPVKGTSWTTGGRAFAFTRTFRLFGHGAPKTYMEPEEVFPASRFERGGMFVAKATGGGGFVQRAQEFQALGFRDGAPATPRIVWNLRQASYEYPRSGNAEEASAETGTSRLCLDARYEGLSAGGRLLVADTRPGGSKRLVTIQKVDQAQDALGAVTDTVTRVTVAPAVGSLPDRRTVVVYELGRELELAPARYPAAITGDTIYLPGRMVEGGAIEIGRRIERGAFTPGAVLRPEELEVGRAVILADARKQPVSARLKAPATLTTADSNGFCHLVLKLAIDGVLQLRTDSATLQGNVARASHGETVRDEIVGSGDASAAFQRFTLKRKPLTYVPGEAASGVDSSLVVLVNGVRWEQVPTLYGRAADAHAFEARLVEEGETELLFGDGEHGARLPTGRNNVSATYRSGLGLAGRVGAGALTTALDRPPGLLAVSNPLAATGGADPETRDAARRSAPRTVRTFGRAVSLRDFEDLVTASGEVAKAQATWTWDGLGRAVHVTVAGQAGGTFLPEDLRRLAASLTAARDPNHPLRLENYVPVDVVVRAAVGVDADRKRSQVEAAARAALLEALAFDALELGRPLGLSDVYRILQEVPGVAYVDVDELRFKDPAEQAARALEPGPVQPRLAVFPARPDRDAPGGVRPGELVRVATPTQDVTLTPKGGLDG
jgi:baseplate J-like protein